VDEVGVVRELRRRGSLGLAIVDIVRVSVWRYGGETKKETNTRKAQEETT
jgi:hypothetical protein